MLVGQRISEIQFVFADADKLLMVTERGVTLLLDPIDRKEMRPVPNPLDNYIVRLLEHAEKAKRHYDATPRWRWIRRWFARRNWLDVCRMIQDAEARRPPRAQ